MTPSVCTSGTLLEQARTAVNTAERDADVRTAQRAMEQEASIVSDVTWQQAASEV